MKHKAYEREMRLLHGELVAMQEWVKASGAKICVVFEGRDPAGKRGAIKRDPGAGEPRQEVYALLTVYQALCAFEAEAATAAGIDPDRISFTVAVRIARDHVISQAAATPPPWSGHAPRSVEVRTMTARSADNLRTKLRSRTLTAQVSGL